MGGAIVLVVALLVALGVGFAVRTARRRSTALRRLGDFADAPRWLQLAAGRSVSSIIVRHRWLSVAAGGGVYLALWLGFGWPLWLALAFGFVLGSIVWIAEDFQAGLRELTTEGQVADAIDLMVAGLRSGTSLVDAIGIAAQEARKPLRPALDEVVRRLQLGDSPEATFHDFSLRVPLETSQILSFSLTVHWRVGGSLAPALVTVAQGARQRIEFARRVRSQATEGRASLVGMLAITYVLTLLLWRAYPSRFEAFFASEIGVALTAVVVLMQGVGLVWMTVLTKIRP
jgi:Flp pilus assembly protein TadB